MKGRVKQPLLRCLPLLFLFAPAGVSAANSAIEPVAKDGRWMQRHEEFVARAAQGGIDVLFLGDSITDFWRMPERGLPVWEKEFAPLKAVNFGISADRTQHVLWRLQHGEADGYQPKVVVLLIGTNNTGFERNSSTPRNTTGETIEGITAVVHELRTRFPEAQILFLALFPRDDGGPAQRAQVAEVNAAIAHLDDGQYVHFLDIGDKFLGSDGSIPADIMPDKLHPGTKGYQIWADAIGEPLHRLLGK